MKHPWYFYYLKAAISKIWAWSPARRQALAEALVGTGRKCAKCGKVIEQTIKLNKRGKKRRNSGVEVDHIIPVVDPATGQTTWDEYITRKLDATVKDLQILCKPCHQLKTQAENALRRKKAA